MNSVIMSKERLHYIDIAKGVLILMVVYGHVYGVNQSINHPLLYYIHLSANSFVAYYMPCFFVITGFCSNFKKPFKEFLSNSVKTIVLPAFSFSLLFFILARQFDLLSIREFIKLELFYGGEFWFLSSLFLARLMYWSISRLFSDRSLALLCIIFFVIGYSLNSFPHKYECW